MSANLPISRVPISRVPIAIRVATAGDLAFIDELQDEHYKMVGYMPTKQLESKIAAGHVLIAEDETRSPIGYCISTDRYFKHDDIGVIYQLNVVPGKQRHLVGATLIKAVFERAAYGCKLFCCWCAQDIQANHFWESIGFIPLAFRAGSRAKGRVHIFWQRRIREGDTTTPYWFPSETTGGAMSENRLVLPIPPGTHWSDAKPVILPATSVEPTALPAPRPSRAKKPVTLTAQRPKNALPAWGFAPPKLPKVEKPKREKKPKLKNDPAHVAAARELRDRYLEQFNSGVLADGTNMLPSGKYAVSRQIETSASTPLLLENKAA